jgi:hypothetical protein
VLCPHAIAQKVTPMNPIPIGDWVNFFVAEVGASAALTGLVVVAISVNLPKILANAHLPGRAAEPLILLVGIMAVASLALVPNAPAIVLGIAVLAVGTVMFVFPLVIQMRSPTAPRWLLRATLSAASSLPIVIAGLLLAAGSATGFYWEAAGVIISLIAGVFNAWVLLIEILR